MSKSVNINVEQKLFLIEFLIGTVRLDEEVVREDLIDQQTCVKFLFLNFPQMNICERDVLANKQTTGAVSRFNSGKSLMFAVKKQELDNQTPITVELNVYKFDSRHPHEIVGSVKICLNKLFKCVVDESVTSPGNSPSSKSTASSYELLGDGKVITGEIDVFIRLTCFGENIVTEFHCGNKMGEDPVLMRKQGTESVFECKPFQPVEVCESSGTSEESGQGDYRETYGSQRDNSTRRSSQTCGTLPCCEKRYPNRDPNMISFDMPDRSGHCRAGEHNVVQYNVSKQDNNYRVIPSSIRDEYRTADGQTQAQLDTDPSQDVFVLNMGSKNKKNKKPKMQLELRTPKQVILPVVLPPYHEDVAVQTQEEKGKKGKKGKKKK